MRRYDPYLDSSECFQGMEESPDGEWVNIDDLGKEIEARELLKRAMDLLQDYCTELNGMNCYLSKEIEEFLKN